MHACLHIIMDHEPDPSELLELMAPYDESELFGYDEETEEEFEPDTWPQFHWDYYREFDPFETDIQDADQCVTIMGPDKHVISREWFDGNELIDQTEKFETYVQNEKPKWIAKGYKCFELDYHF